MATQHRAVGMRQVVAVAAGLGVYTLASLALAGPTWGALVGPLALLLSLPSLLNEYRTRADTTTVWRRWADRLARAALLILLGSVVYGLVVGAIVAAAWRPGGDFVAYNRPFYFHGLAMIAVLALSVPGLLVGGRDLLRGQRAEGTARLLTTLGAIGCALGLDLLSHLLNQLVLCDLWPGLCQDGADITVQWHQLNHTLVAGAPLAFLYWLALRRWRPEIGRLR